MDSILEILKVLIGRSQPTLQENMIVDSTLYHVETTSHIYCGKIHYQDNMCIKLQTEKPRIVKILKENIKQITIANQSLKVKKLGV